VRHRPDGPGADALSDGSDAINFISTSWSTGLTMWALNPASMEHAATYRGERFAGDRDRRRLGRVRQDGQADLDSTHAHAAPIRRWPPGE